ncbi:MAG: CvpA family protein [Bacilli bacterium]|nr:CvpA family protein [Bacilli bacterium]
MTVGTLNLIDLIIVLLLLIGGVVGFKEGVIKKLTSFIGLFVVIILAFALKNKLSIYFYENLPFLDLWGVFKGIQILNVVFYELVSFLIIASVLMLVYRLLLLMTGLIEKVLKATVILSIPSKLLGFVVGVIESYIWVYVLLFILTLPVLNLKEIHTSKLATFMLKETPVLSKYTAKTVDIYGDIYEIVENREDKTNKELNEETMDLMLKYDMITDDSANKLITSNKVSVSDEYAEKRGITIDHYAVSSKDEEKKKDKPTKGDFYGGNIFNQ